MVRNEGWKYVLADKVISGHQRPWYHLDIRGAAMGLPEFGGISVEMLLEFGL